jgi:hypothetical protein
LPKVKTEVRKYLLSKAGRGGFSLEGLTAFLDMVHRDPINWNLSGAADETYSIVWRAAWSEVQDEGAEAARAQRRRDMLDSLEAFVNARFDGKEWEQAQSLLDRARNVVGNEFMWETRRPEADKDALAQLCELAGIDEVTDEDEAEDDKQISMRFTFDGGQKIDRVIAFPDPTVPGKMRSVYSQFCTIGQYERHTTMSRDHVDRSDQATADKEKKLAWMLDQAAGDRAKLIYDLRDGSTAPPSPGPEDRPRP